MLEVCLDSLPVGTMPPVQFYPVDQVSQELPQERNVLAVDGFLQLPEGLLGPFDDSFQVRHGGLGFGSSKACLEVVALVFHVTQTVDDARQPVGRKDEEPLVALNDLLVEG